LQAAFSSVQTLHGDLDEAVCQHALHYSVWRKYAALPERFNWKTSGADVKFYPLRPELAESTYFLYRATRSPFYLRVGSEILDDLNAYARSQYGYATLHDVDDMSQKEDRMESFFLSETCKYLYLLFDEENKVNKREERYLFTTEGHILPINGEIRRKKWDDEDFMSEQTGSKVQNVQCQNPGFGLRHSLPLRADYLQQVFDQVGERKIK